MKLDRLMPGACAALVVASLLACGCSSSTTRDASSAAERAARDERTATTELMSAQLAGPAPKVGKSHLTVDDDDVTTASAAADDPSAPKEARREGGSRRRAGNFGTSK